jgi:transposase-like protein
MVLAVSYLPYRLPYAHVAELLAERGVYVDASTVFDWLRHEVA